MSNNNSRNALRTTREENFSEWYQEVITAAELAENSMVRGCMIIKPWGYAIWERIKEILDKELKKSGHENCYFPMFIPLELFEKEAEHVSGFAKEMAVVTHHRLESNSDGKLIPAGELESPLIVRPTSETIIGESFAKWIKSYRDLPLKINQWTNVVRWEMRTRIFLRTSEFLWQEGHTAHSTEEEASKETSDILDLYVKLVQESMKIPVYAGIKTQAEKFPGASETLCIEAIMQDGKALQSGTSHYLGQNFSKAAEIKFQTDKGDLDYAYTTSWGCSTRLIGALIMTHSDDNGLRLPSDIAPYQIVIIPIIKNPSAKEKVLQTCHKLNEEINGFGFRSSMVMREDVRGEKWKWIKKGVPLIVEIGEKELNTNIYNIIQRVDLGNKVSSHADHLLDSIKSMLENNDEHLWRDAKSYTEALCVSNISNKDDLISFLSTNEKHHAIVPFDESAEESFNDIVAQYGHTIRCKIFIADLTEKNCTLTGKPATHQIIIAKAY